MVVIITSRAETQAAKAKAEQRKIVFACFLLDFFLQVTTPCWLRRRVRHLYFESLWANNALIIQRSVAVCQFLCGNIMFSGNNSWHFWPTQGVNNLIEKPPNIMMELAFFCNSHSILSILVYSIGVTPAKRTWQKHVAANVAANKITDTKTWQYSPGTVAARTRKCGSTHPEATQLLTISAQRGGQYHARRSSQRLPHWVWSWQIRWSGLSISPVIVSLSGFSAFKGRTDSPNEMSGVFMGRYGKIWENHLWLGDFPGYVWLPKVRVWLDHWMEIVWAICIGWNRPNLTKKRMLANMCPLFYCGTYGRVVNSWSCPAFPQVTPATCSSYILMDTLPKISVNQ